jgi:hypothetical membrane protein
LLACGVAAAALSIVTDLVAGSLSSGYDFVRQSISDLAAVGAPTRSLVVPAEITDDLLLLAFGAGLWRAGGDDRALRVTAALVAVNAVSGLGVELFPMHLGRPASENTPGVALGATGVIALVGAMAASAVAIPGRFRRFSTGILGAFAALTVMGLTVVREPATGIQERTMAYTFAVWLAVLAAVLWRRSGPDARRLA